MSVSQSPNPEQDAPTQAPASALPEEAPTLAPGEPSVDEPSATKLFGDYELLAPIARGGMGVVYKARQRSLNRIVALKMILAGEYADGDSIQRFQREAEAAGNLDHPHIVPIYEVGRHAEKPYYSMKLIEGGSMASLLSELRKDLPRAIGTMVKVAQAVHFAHQRGIIHRDLKPGNVLIDSNGEPHVMDFGLAKRTSGSPDEHRMTQTGAIVGTPAYMAPEQARAEKVLTTGADVYSLGAMLYEVLTGQPPFSGAPLDVIMQVVSDDPPAPHVRVSGVDRDLESICLKALEKEPARRYSSAAELAEELERWLRGEPILTRAAGRLERGWRWIKRNQVLSAGIASTAAALIAGATVSAIFAWQAHKEAERALTNAQQANISKLRAAALAQNAREALDQTLSSVIEDLLSRQKEFRPEYRQFLEQTLKTYNTLAEKAQEDREFRLSHIRATRRIAALLQKLGQAQSAESVFRQEMSLAESLYREDPTLREAQQELLQSQTDLGLVLRQLDKLAEAEQVARQGLSLSRDLSSTYSAELALRSEVIRRLISLAECLGELGKGSAALEPYREAEQLQRELIAGRADDLAQQRFYAGIIQSEAYLLRWKIGDVPASVNATRKALEIWRQLRLKHPQDLGIAMSFADQTAELAIGLQMLRDFGGAARTYREALDQYALLAKEQPQNSYIQKRLGELAPLAGSGQYDLKPGAKLHEAALNREVEECRKRVAEFPSVFNGKVSLAWALTRKGWFLGNEQQRFAEAVTSAEEARQLFIQLGVHFPDDLNYPLQAGWRLNDQGRWLLKLGKEEDGIKACRAAIAEIEHLADRASEASNITLDCAEMHADLAAHLMSGGSFFGSMFGKNRSAEALALTENGHRRIKKLLAKAPTQALEQRSQQMYWLEGTCLQKLGRYAEAYRALLKAGSVPGIAVLKWGVIGSGYALAESHEARSDLPAQDWIHDATCYVAATQQEQSAEKKARLLDKAMDRLQRAAKLGWFKDGKRRDELGVDPVFVVLHDRPEFQKLIKRQ